MGELSETYKAFREYKKEKREERHELNEKILKASVYFFADKGSVFLFRENGKPKVDFYPSTGRWKVGNKVRKGGAVAFIAWYSKQ